MDIAKNLKLIQDSLPKQLSLVAVSKTKPISDILIAYSAGQRIFGENKALELVKKAEKLPSDIQWHMIGHLQRNKVKYIAPFVSLIHGIDSIKLLKEVNKRAAKSKRVIDCLLQVHIAKESTKFGFNLCEINQVILDSSELKNIRITGLMGMATFTNDTKQIEEEFKSLNTLFDSISNETITILSMGMSGDYKLAIQEGSTMVRIGSAIFGNRN